MGKYGMNVRRRAAAGLLGMVMIFGGQTVLAADGIAAASVEAWQAEEIAFDDAAVMAELVERLQTKEEWEDGESVYEVSFSVDGVEYEYLIREADGVILEWEINGRDLSDATAEESLKNDEEDTLFGSAETLIGMDRAKEIALQDAGADPEKASFSKIKFERDSRKVIYELEFYYVHEEMEYTINAYSGEIEWD